MEWEGAERGGWVEAGGRAAADVRKMVTIIMSNTRNTKKG